MKQPWSGCVVLASIAAMMPISRAQQAQSTNYQLADFGFDDGGGGMASFGFAGWGSIGGAPAGYASSLNYEAEIGVLANNDPTLGNDPMIFGVTPKFGPKSGGQLITVSGLNFDKFGVGPTVNVFIGGLPCTSVQVLSNGLLTAVTPANGQPGSKTVTVTSFFGSDNQFAGFLNTPAIQTTPAVPLGQTLEIDNYGPNGATFLTFVSTQRTVLPTPYGPLLIGPTPLIQLFAGIPYFAPDGITSIPVTVPTSPVFHGLIVYFQSFALTNPSPAAGSFTNVATTVLQ